MKGGLVAIAAFFVVFCVLSANGTPPTPPTAYGLTGHTLTAKVLWRSNSWKTGTTTVGATAPFTSSPLTLLNTEKFTIGVTHVGRASKLTFTYVDTAGVPTAPPSNVKVTLSLDPTSLYIESITGSTGATSVKTTGDQSLSFTWTTLSTPATVSILQAGVGFYGRRWQITQPRYFDRTGPESVVGVVQFDNPTTPYADGQELTFTIPTTSYSVKAKFNDRTIALQAYNGASTTTLPSGHTFEFDISPRNAEADYVLPFGTLSYLNGDVDATVRTPKILHVVLDGNNGQAVVWFGSNGLIRHKLKLSDWVLHAGGNDYPNCADSYQTENAYPGFTQFITVNDQQGGYSYFSLIEADDHVVVKIEPALPAGVSLTSKFTIGSYSDKTLPLWAAKGSSTGTGTLTIDNVNLFSREITTTVSGDGGRINVEFNGGLLKHSYKFTEVTYWNWPNKKRSEPEPHAIPDQLTGILYEHEIIKFVGDGCPDITFTIEQDEIKVDTSNLDGGFVTGILVPNDPLARGFKYFNGGGPYKKRTGCNFGNTKREEAAATETTDATTADSANAARTYSNCVFTEWLNRTAIGVFIGGDGHFDVDPDSKLLSGNKWIITDYAFDSVADTNGLTDTWRFGDTVTSRTITSYGKRLVFNPVTDVTPRVTGATAAYSFHVKPYDPSSVRVIRGAKSTPANRVKFIDGGLIRVNIPVGEQTIVDLDFWDCPPLLSGDNCDNVHDPEESGAIDRDFDDDAENYSVHIDASAADVPGAIRFVFEPVPATTSVTPFPAGWSGIGATFELYATDIDGNRISNQFNNPITLTFAGDNIDANTQIYIYKDNQWVDLLTTCPLLAPEVARVWDANNDELIYKVCHFTLFSALQLTPAVHNSTVASSDPNTVITIQGENFGVDPNLVEVLIDGEICGTLVLVDEQTIHCTLIGQTGTGVAGTVTVGTLVANFLYNASAPVITSITPNTGLSAGDTITIEGQNLGNKVEDIEQIRVAGNPCGGAVWVELGKITCTVPDSVGTNNDVFLWIGQTGAQANVVAGVVHYLTPTVAECVGHQDVIHAETTLGGEIITLCGTNLGDNNVNNSYWEGARVITVGTVPAEVISYDGTSVSFVIPEGADVDNKVWIDVNGVVLLAPFKVSFPGPTATKVTPSVISSSARNAGTRITIYGTGFGPDVTVLTLRRSATVGALECTQVQWISQSSLSCLLPPGTGGNLAVVVTIGTQSSDVLHGPVVDFSDTTVSGLSCSLPNGAQDALNPEVCNCFSGFAPSTGLATDCSVSATCPGKTIQANIVGGHAPHAPHSSFSNDHLKLVQKAPIVHGRRDVHISFVNVANDAESIATCNYPSSPIWTKTVDSLDCLDVYTVVIPWTQHGSCAFVEDVSGPPAYRTYTTQIVTTYRELLPGSTPNVNTLVRTSTSTYDVVVKFVRTLTAVSTSASVVIQQDRNIGVTVVDDILYDPANLETFIVIDTTGHMPFKLTALNGNWTPAADNTPPADYALVVTATLQNPQPGDAVCDLNGDCVQRWTIRIQNAGPTTEVCNLKGSLVFVPDVVCSDGITYGPCTAYETPLNVTLIFAEDTDLCEHSSDDADASAGSKLVITTFEDADFSFPQSTFGPADIIHIALSLVDPISTIDQATIHSIVIQGDAGSPQTLYAVTVPGGVATTNVAAAHLNVTSELRPESSAPLSPASEFILSFNFIASRNLATFAGLNAASDPVIPLTITVIVDLKFHGNDNRKRTVAIALAGDSLQKSVSAPLQITLGDVDADLAAEQANTENVDNIFDFGYSAATSTFVSVFAAVFAVAMLFF